MIRLLSHNGFIEPSNGVKCQGFAIRGSAKLKIRLGESEILEKLHVTLYRTSKHWPNAHIKIQLNDLVPYRLRIEDIGQKEISIDLPSEIHASDIEITFSIFPQGILRSSHTSRIIPGNTAFPCKLSYLADSQASTFGLPVKPAQLIKNLDWFDAKKFLSLLAS